MNKIPKTVDQLNNAVVPLHILLPKGMIVPEEQILLYLLARDMCPPGGVIVDAGAFCGASAYAFAAGIKDANSNGQIHSYDLFQVDDSYTKQYIQNNFYYFTDLEGGKRFEKTRISSGDSFVDVFKFQTQRYSDIINIHQGSILEFKSPTSSIDILFIDVAKTLEIQKHLFMEFLPSLTPGTGILIQQDFHHAYHPYIHVAMEYLRDYFEITHTRIGASRVYRLLKKIPYDLLTRVIIYDFTNDEVFKLMNDCIIRSPRDEQALLTILLARHLVLNEDDRLSNVIIQFINDYSSSSGFDWYVNEMKAAVGPLAKFILEKHGYT